MPTRIAVTRVIVAINRVFGACALLVGGLILVTGGWRLIKGETLGSHPYLSAVTGVVFLAVGILGLNGPVFRQAFREEGSVKSSQDH